MGRFSFNGSFLRVASRADSRDLRDSEVRHYMSNYWNENLCTVEAIKTKSSHAMRHLIAAALTRTSIKRWKRMKLHVKQRHVREKRPISLLSRSSLHRNRKRDIEQRRAVKSTEYGFHRPQKDILFIRGRILRGFPLSKRSCEEVNVWTTPLNRYNNVFDNKFRNFMLSLINQ